MKWAGESLTRVWRGEKGGNNMWISGGEKVFLKNGGRKWGNVGKKFPKRGKA